MDAILGATTKVLNDQDEISNTALHLAAEGGHLEIVEKLVDIGTNKESRLKELPVFSDAVPAYFVPTLQNLPIFGFLHEKKKKKKKKKKNPFRNYKKETPLDLAAENGHENVVKFFIEEDVSPNPMDKDKASSLSLSLSDSLSGIFCGVLTRLFLEISLRKTYIYMKKTYLVQA